MRISYITAGFPFPLSSGYLRHHHFLRHLAPHHRIRLRSLVGSSFDHDAVVGVAGLVEDVRTFRAPPSTGARRAVRHLRPSRRPDVRAMRAVIAADLADGVDVVVVSGKETASVLEVARHAGVAAVVDLCDATSARITQEMQLGGSGRRAALALRRASLRRQERTLVDGGDVLLAASARDRELLLDEGAPPRVGDAVVVPNGIDLRTWRRRSARLGTKVVLCGNMGYRPNADAAIHLVEELMPRVWATVPEAEVEIVGTGPSRELAERLAVPRVHVTGAVDDVRPHLEGAAVVAAPLRIATGIQNKLLEALAMEVPVVTSPVAAAGLGDDAPVTATDAADEAASAIVDRLLTVAVGDTTPHAAARTWVGARFDWARSGELLDEALATATGTSTPKGVGTC